MAKYHTMEKKRTTLDEVLDENVLTETVFVRKDGKLKMLRRKVVVGNQSSGSEKPLFPISKERR
jgi:hypothetical protein